MMKVVIDTNIIIDAMTRREPFNVAAEKIFLLAANRIVDMYITASSATDIYYLLRKHLHSTDQAKRVMSKLYDLFYLLDVIGDDCITALSSDIQDYEDAVVSCCSYRNQMQYIVTRNIRDYQNSKVKAIMPDDFIEIIMENEE